MFTGIIQTQARLESLNRRDFVELTVAMEPPAEVRLGDSVAIDGACLTVARMEGDRFAFQLSKETLSLSRFADLGRGTFLNVELPLRMQDFLGGHLVSGHLDGTARSRAVRRGSGAATFSFTYTDTGWRRYLVHKGSVSINGISLTLTRVEASYFSVEVIPHTLEATNLKHLRVGERVNVELDLIAKYLYNLQLRKSHDS